MIHPFKASRPLATSLRIHDPMQQRGTLRGQRVSAQPKSPATAPDLEEAADLYFRKQSRGLEYRHFDSAAAAIRFVRENLTSKQQDNCVLQVGERRFEGSEVVSMLKRTGNALAESVVPAV